MYLPAHPEPARDFSGLHLAIWTMRTAASEPQSFHDFPCAEKSTDDMYSDIVQDMRDLYDEEMSTTEAHDAARNLIGFVQTVLAINRRLEQDNQHAKLQ